MEHCNLYYPAVMEPPGEMPPDRDRQLVLQQQPNINLTTTATTTTSAQSNSSLLGISAGGHQPLERLCRPMAFDKMEALLKEMQDAETGVPVRQQKTFLTSIPHAFMGYDLIEWLMDRLNIEESEALNNANQFCMYGYLFPVNDTKTLVVKDDSSLYRFQSPYYWPWQEKNPDNVDYAIYLVKRTMRNKQRHGLEDYENDAMNSLHKNLKGKWDFILMQAEEQSKIAKDRKKMEKIVADSQERAFWRVHRPPPGQFSPLEQVPFPNRDRSGKPKKKTIDDLEREVEYLKKSLTSTRMKISQACEGLVSYSETFSDYDYILHPAVPSNPWVTEDTTFWQLNNSIVDAPTEKRVKRWAISIEELVSDGTGLQEFTKFLEKEYSHENIRFWIAVNRLRSSSSAKMPAMVKEIYEEFLKPGAPCEINIDGKTMEIVQQELQKPSRFAFDAAAHHIYTLLLKKDCYPRFIRSEHYKTLLAKGFQPMHKKRFFNFGGVGAKKKSSTATGSSHSGIGAHVVPGHLPPGHLSRRRGSDRSITGSAHELAVVGVRDAAHNNKVPHSHSQTNLSEIPFGETVYRGDMPTQAMAMDGPIARTVPRGSTSQATDNACLVKSYHGNRDAAKPRVARLETTMEASSVCPWETDAPAGEPAVVCVSVCPWEDDDPIKEPVPDVPNTPQTPGLPSTSTAAKKGSDESLTSDISEVSERMKRSCGLRQHTVDSDYNSKRLTPNTTEQRRSSMTYTPRKSEYQHTDDTNASNDPSPTPTPQGESQAEAQVDVQDPRFQPTESKPMEVAAQTEPGQTTPKHHQSSENVDANAMPATESECPPPSDNRNQPDSVQTITNINTNRIFETNTNISALQSIKTDTDKKDVADILDTVGDEVEGPTIDSTVLAKRKTSLQLDIDVENVPLPPPPEESSPTTEEYKEGAEFAHQSKSYEYDVDVDTNISPGCVAPAPTPAPAMAPLAEDETDTVDDETEFSVADPMLESTSTGAVKLLDSQETKKKRKKRDSDAKKADADEKTDEAERNAVCPWEDEDGSSSDATFVKTYATLGYL